MSDNCQKIKLLKLHEILRTESDEQNPLTTGELLTRLADCGISCDRRTLAKDMETLNRQGFEVMVRRVGHQKGYYVEDRGFSLPELKILMDAVQAAGFITERKAEDLSGKIASLGGSHRADLLTRHMLLFNTRKHSNESIYYNVDRLEEAIRERCKVSFRYFDLDENCARVYRKNGEAYVSEADCPDGICAAHRPISHVGETIVCLPHRVVIKVETSVVQDAPDMVVQ